MQFLAPTIHSYRKTNIKYALVGKYSIPGGFDDGHEKIEVLQEYVNPDFDYNKKTHDQMLLKLARPSSAPFVNVNLQPNVPTQNSRITVIGLGRIKESGGKPNVLQQVTLDYEPNTECEKASNQQFTYKGEIHDDMVCVIGDNTEYEDEGHCYGDSGGPYLLLGNSPGEDVQIATVSW